MTAPADHPRLALLLDLAERAGTVAMKHFQSASLAVESKPDHSPVTEADTEIEAMLRAAILAEFPDDALLGEEFGEESGAQHGASAGTSGWRWVIDPIDGTVSFAAGVPLFGTLIGLEHGGRVVAGICAMPALGERVWAAEGLGAWWERTDADGAQHRVPARVRRCTRLADALVCTTGLEYFERAHATDALVRVAQRARRMRGWSDCYGGMLVATGRADAWIDPVMNPWDSGPFPVILAEAGGVFTDWTGAPDIRGGSAIACHAELHAELLATVAPTRAQPGASASASHSGPNANA